jgi:phage regulator Rha-like protein
MTTTASKPQRASAVPTTEQIVAVVGNQPTTTSVSIAEIFDRPHKNVLQSLDGLTADGTIDRLYFKPIFYTDEMNREQRAYQLSERAALIAMPFIGGRKSREGQRTLVDAFLAARKEVNRLQQLHSDPTWQQARLEGKATRIAETDTIKTFIEYSKLQGSRSASRYYMVLSKETNRSLFFIDGACGRDFRDRLTPQQLASLAMGERIVERSLLESMAAKTYYKDAFRAAADRVRQFASLIGQTMPGRSPVLLGGDK